MILYYDTYEREGNDAWLVDHVELHSNAIGLYLDHKRRWKGWNGDINGNHTLELDAGDIEGSQKKIDDYIREEGLYHEYPSGKTEGIKIDLRELLER